MRDSILSEGCKAVGHRAENHCWLSDAPPLSGEAVSVSRKASASSNAARLFSEWFIALAAQFSPSENKCVTKGIRLLCSCSYFGLSCLRSLSYLSLSKFHLFPHENTEPERWTCWVARSPRSKAVWAAGGEVKLHELIGLTSAG